MTDQNSSDQTRTSRLWDPRVLCSQGLRSCNRAGDTEIPGNAEALASRPLGNRKIGKQTSSNIQTLLTFISFPVAHRLLTQSLLFNDHSLGYQTNPISRATEAVLLVHNLLISRCRWYGFLTFSALLCIRNAAASKCAAVSTLCLGVHMHLCNFAGKRVEAIHL